MRKLPEVQEAKELMAEAKDWSVFKWLFEKPRVRETADRANDALDRLDRATKKRWGDEIKAAYKELRKSAGAGRRDRKGSAPSSKIDPEIRSLVEKVREADDAAEDARMDAEKAFDEAEAKMSVSLAREGCQKAIHSWELHEKAIRKAEAIVDSAEAGE